MKPLAIAGILLIVLGVAALAYQQVSYTSRETVVDVGPIKATADREKTVALPPVMGAAVVGIGVILLFLGRRGKKA